MKKIYLMIIPVAMAFVSSCSNGEKQQDTVDSAVSPLDTFSLADLPIEENDSFSFTSAGVGPVKVGMKVSDLPVQVKGLYDKYLVSQTPDAVAYTYLLNDDPQFTIYDFMQGNVDVVILEGPALAFSTPNGDLRVGDSFAKVLALKDATPEWEAIDGDEVEGTWYWRYNGLYIGVDEGSLTDAQIEEVLFNKNRSPRAGDLGKNAKIGYIGTGLPF